MKIVVTDKVYETYKNKDKQQKERENREKEPIIVKSSLTKEER